MTDLNLEAVLCYVEGHWAYFTTQNLDKQWGDDWDNAPYEHNAGSPYSYAEYDKAAGKDPWEIYRVGWLADLDDPAYEKRNSQVSVDQINAKKVPWLRTPDYWKESTKIWAGTKLGDFIAMIKRMDGEVYAPTATSLVEDYMGDK